jgi:hypothetical protein
MSDSQQLLQKCSSYAPTPTASDLGEMAKQMFSDSAAYTQGCDLSSYFGALAGKLSIGPMGLGGDASFAAQMNGLKKSGCQTFAANLGNFLNACYQAKCIINNDSTSQTQSITSSQNVNVIISGGSTVYNTNCPNGVNIKQAAKLNGRVIVHISTNAASAIKNVVEQAQQNTARQLAKIADGYQSTGSGLAAIQALQQKVVNQDQATALNNAIKNLNNEMALSQNITYEVLAGSTAINVFPCTINQDTIMNVQIASMISAAYSEDFKDSLKLFAKSSQGQTLSVVSAGAPNVVGDFVKNNLSYIIGVIVVVILGIFLLKFLKSKQGQELMSNGIGAVSKKMPAMSKLPITAFRRLKF